MRSLHAARLARHALLLAPRPPIAPAPAAPRRAAAADGMLAAAAPAAETGAELQIERVHCLQDNYSWLLRDPASGAVAVVDPAETGPVVEALRRLGWTLTHVLNTHHHDDHTGGNLALKARYGATVVGAAADAHRIPGIDVALRDGETYSLGGAAGAATLTCYDTPGHTAGHVTLHFPASKALFPGDTLFSLGCGRLFEGTPAQMWASLSKFAGMPDDTRVYCAHEYTASNARFAASIDPQNARLAAMKAAIDAARAAGEPTVPSLLGDERAANPFLRAESCELRAALGVAPGAPDAEAFAAIRAAKDRFR
jgi:hydroxyacylglutathione hydrolase